MLNELQKPRYLGRRFPFCSSILILLFRMCQLLSKEVRALPLPQASA